MKIIKKSLDLAGRELSLETGRVAGQADGAVLARYGDTMVLSTVVLGKETDLDYMPLTVEYVERLYAGGKIKGSRWVKREGRPSDEAILSARLIDRSTRPLFPKNFRREVQVVVTVLSVDGDNDPDVLGIIATSAALSLSVIPWQGPVAAVRMGFVAPKNGNQGHPLLNPTAAEMEFSELDLVLGATSGKMHMLEAGGNQIPEEYALKSIKLGLEESEKIIALIKDLTAQAGATKITAGAQAENSALHQLITRKYQTEIKEIMERFAKSERVNEEINVFLEKVMTENAELQDKKIASSAIDEVIKERIRSEILVKERRPDGRAPGEIREIAVEVGLLPRTHGSAIFRRGQTQVLTVATLGSPSLEQLIESAQGEETKRYIHHYSMPPYSVGETGRVGFPSRREIGHGALAERALEPVIPTEEDFPYTIRLVSEVLSSNGSTSMASTCGSTMALMDAGVPIAAPVAGVSVGLVSDEKSGKYVLLSDISGLEDFKGDMDFKVAGTESGITAIQTDTKITGLTFEIITEVFKQAKTGRDFILAKMREVLNSPRKTVSVYAPKVQIVKVPTDKIGEVIGPGGKVIRQIIAATSTTVDVDDDGAVTISGMDSEAVSKAVAWVESLVKPVELGFEADGTVKRIMPFGAFVEFSPGKEGLVHVSKMSVNYVGSPDEVVKIGDIVHVRVEEIDDKERVNLTMLPKGALPIRREQGGHERRPQRSFVSRPKPFRLGFGKNDRRRPFRRTY